ncbi:MAG: hypothetical protein II838_12745 [Lachnospiraceae bacterium]|nr:hypothetical protein [Lachnospiraceae bacterium]
MSQEKKTLCYLILGNFIYASLISLIGVFLLRLDVRFAFGVFLSSIGASIVAVHMFFSLQKSIDMGEEGAMKRERTQALKRMLIMIMVVSVGLVLPAWFHPLGIVAGVFALKVSAYLQPFFIYKSQKVQQD